MALLDEPFDPDTVELDDHSEPSKPFNPDDSFFKQNFQRYLDAGYTPIPIMPRNKVPGSYQRNRNGGGTWQTMPRWNDFTSSVPPASMYAIWQEWPDANIGIVLGGDHDGYATIAIDFDTDIESELELLQSSIPFSPMRKKGHRGYTAFYRAPLTCRTKRYPVPDPQPNAPKKQRMLLEVLTGNAPRQTVMPPSLHPFGMQYAFMNHDAIVPVGRLPILTQDDLDRLEDNLSQLDWAGEVGPAMRDRTAPDDDANIWRQTNDAALRNLDAWCPELGLPKLKRLHSGAWEAVPTWRPSNSGTETMQRKSNLKINKLGIKDMGSNVGYTPLDVVCVAFSWDFDTAFRWLRGKLGMDGDLPADLPEKPSGVVFVEADDGTISDETTGEIVAVELPPEGNVELPDRLTRVPGLVGQLFDFIEASARRPNPVLSIAAAITLFGTIIGRRDATPTASGTHLYTLALAPSGAGKQHGIDAIYALMKAAGAGFHIGPSEFMSQTSVIDALTTQPLQLCVCDEFGAFLDRMNAPRGGVHDHGIKKVLRSAWGSSYKEMARPAWAKKRNNRPDDDDEPTPTTIYAPALSIYGPSTPGEFFQAVQGGDIVNGMLNRFLLFATGAKSKDVDPVAVLTAIPEGITEQLKHAYSVRRNDFADGEITPFIVPWGNGAKEIYRELVDECERRGDENEAAAPHFARTPETAARLATIIAVGQNIDDPAVSVADMTWGRDLALWSSERMASDAGDFVANNDYARNVGKIMRMLKEAKGKPVRDRELYQPLSMKVKDLTEYMRDLQVMGRIRREKVKSKGGETFCNWLVANDNLKKKPRI